MFWCYSLKTSHPRLLPQSPKVCSVHLCLFYSAGSGKPLKGVKLEKWFVQRHIPHSLQQRLKCNPTLVTSNAVSFTGSQHVPLPILLGSIFYILIQSFYILIWSSQIIAQLSHKICVSDLTLWFDIRILHCLGWYVGLWLCWPWSTEHLLAPLEGTRKNRFKGRTTSQSLCKDDGGFDNYVVLFSNRAARTCRILELSKWKCHTTGSQIQNYFHVTLEPVALRPHFEKQWTGCLWEGKAL